MENNYSPSDYSKFYIVQALFSLMQGREFNEITVTDIVRKAGVGRATFYRYFTSKEDVIRFYFHKTTKEFNMTRRYKARNVDDHKDMITAVMKKLYENKQEFSLIIKAHLEYLYLDFVNENMAQNFVDESYDENKYLPLCYAGMLYNVSVSWVKNGCQEPIEQVVDAVVKSALAL